MKVLYIGPYSIGSTCSMRGEIMRSLLNNPEFIIIDTEKILNSFNKIIKTIGFRYKIGPVVEAINSEIIKSLNSKYDLIWVDKGIFITEETTKKLKDKTEKLIHYTPDPAFLYHKSNHFYRSISYYDYCISTKSYEVDIYKSRSVKNLIITTQGFDPSIHRPYHNFEDKNGIVFIGHYEKDRAYIIESLFEIEVEIKIAGINWNNFVKKFSNNKKLKYYGSGIFGVDYSKLISSSLFGLGMLSRIVPELHTTRTFEIPACKTILITERNKETSKFFKDDEVVFYNTPEELLNKIKLLMEDKAELKRISEKGYNAVINGGYDYETIMKNLLIEIGVL